MHFGATLEPLVAHEGAIRATLVALWGPFGSTLGPLLVYARASVQLYDYFGIIVESLWVYESRFSENIHFPDRF